MCSARCHRVSRRPQPHRHPRVRPSPSRLMYSARCRRSPSPHRHRPPNPLVPPSPSGPVRCNLPGYGSPASGHLFPPCRRRPPRQGPPPSPQSWPGRRTRTRGFARRGRDAVAGPGWGSGHPWRRRWPQPGLPCPRPRSCNVPLAPATPGRAPFRRKRETSCRRRRHRHRSFGESVRRTAPSRPGRRRRLNPDSLHSRRSPRVSVRHRRALWSPLARDRPPRWYSVQGAPVRDRLRASGRYVPRP
jgi:hypothetical protein